MKLRSTAILLVLGACGGPSKPATTVANRDDACGPLQRMIDAAPDDFAAIREDALALPGGTCEIVDVADLHYVQCEMSRSFEAARDAVRPCLTAPPTSESADAIEWQLGELVSASVVVETDDAGAHVRVYVSRAGQGQGDTY